MRAALPRVLALLAGLFALACGATEAGHTLEREALSGQASWRLLVVPGSGCLSLAPSLGRMFAAAPGASVRLLQKPHVGGTECSLRFLQEDRLSRWRDQAVALAREALARTDARLPLVLVGLSEGAEILPDLARALPDVRALVMVGNAGLDPMVTGGLQAQREGVSERWRQIFEAVDSGGPPERLIEGRSAGYWRDLRDWPLQGPLMQDPRPLIHAWGGQDVLVPSEAFEQFRRQAERARTAPYCALRFPTADHELREPGGDRLQSLWRALEMALRPPGAQVLDCASLRSAAGASGRSGH